MTARGRAADGPPAPLSTTGRSHGLSCSFCCCSFFGGGIAVVFFCWVLYAKTNELSYQLDATRHHHSSSRASERATKGKTDHTQRRGRRTAHIHAHTHTQRNRRQSRRRAEQTAPLQPIRSHRPEPNRSERTALTGAPARMGIEAVNARARDIPGQRGTQQTAKRQRGLCNCSGGRERGIGREDDGRRRGSPYACTTVVRVCVTMRLRL
jgi:hypothetical protein